MDNTLDNDREHLEINYTTRDFFGRRGGAITDTETDGAKSHHLMCCQSEAVNEL